MRLRRRPPAAKLGKTGRHSATRASCDQAIGTWCPKGSTARRCVYGFLAFAASWSDLPIITLGYPLRLNGIFGVPSGKRSMSHPGFGSAIVIGYHLPTGDDLQAPTRSLERTFRRRITRTGQNRTSLRSKMSGRIPITSKRRFEPRISFIAV